MHGNRFADAANGHGTMDDTLKDILNTVALRAALYFRTDFRPPFSVMVPAFERVARFHLLIKGHCSVRLPSGNEVELHPGDLVLVPNGSQHLISSDRESAPMPLDDAFAAAGFTGTGPFILGEGDPAQGCQLICGHFEFAPGADHPLIRTMPEMIFVAHGTRTVRPLFDSLIALLENNLFETGSHEAASIRRLSEALFIETLHANLDQSPGISEVMRAIADPKIGRAIAMIHENVGANLSVELLASHAAMSRTRFAERFHELVGMAPMAYVAEWRLQRALNLISDSDMPIKLVAQRVGYTSPAAFTRSFTKRFAMSPEKVRKSRSDSALH